MDKFLVRKTFLKDAQTGRSSGDDLKIAMSLVQESIQLGTTNLANPQGPLSLIVSQLLRATQINLDRHRALLDFKEEFYKWLTERFNQVGDEPIVALPLLPFCLSERPEVEDLIHCEARFAWDREKNGHPIRRHSPPRAECPRLRGMLCLERITDSRHHFARILSNRSLPWDEWSLLELFDAADIGALHIKAAFPEVRDGDELINRLSGEVNRLNQLRSRMRCRECKSLLHFNHKYAIRDAVYRSTVTKTCEESRRDDGDSTTCPGPSVYFSHCHGCGRIIDSRDSTIKDEGRYYICISCATGNDSEEAGRICPRCGEKNTMAGRGRRKICQSEDCGHRVELPAWARRSLGQQLQPDEPAQRPTQHD